MNRPLLLRGGRVVDPSQDLDGPAGVLVRDGRIEAVGRDIAGPDDAEIMDVTGMVVAPGLIDLHVHLREPGGEHKETIHTGSHAALAGGFTTVWAMPNTDPPIDDPAAVGYVRLAARAARGTQVMPIGAASIGQKGERMTEIGELVKAGAVAVSDDGAPVWDTGLMRRLLEYTQTFGIPVLQHAEDISLAGGVMNEGAVATALGLRGLPNAAESCVVARDIQLAELTGGHLHVCHVSARQSVEQLRTGQGEGALGDLRGHATPPDSYRRDVPGLQYRSQGESAPAHRRGCGGRHAGADRRCHRRDRHGSRSAHVRGKRAGVRLRPVRNQRARDGARVEHAGARPDGTPHALRADRSECPAVRPASWAWRAVRCGRVRRRTSSCLDPDERWTVDPTDFRSRSRNTPIAGWELIGRVHHTLVGGEIRFAKD